jgi:carotenoid cleavage dioxygenase-like enzyme
VLVLCWFCVYVSTCSAHVKRDAHTNELVVFGYQTRRAPYLVYGVADATGHLTVGPVPIQLPEGVMMHDFAMTQHYSVFMDLPLVFDAKAMVAEGVLPFQFRKHRGARFGVLRRHDTNGDAVQWFAVAPCYVFHVVNAWEEASQQGPLPVVVVVASRCVAHCVRKQLLYIGWHGVGAVIASVCAYLRVRVPLCVRRCVECVSRVVFGA